jgi:hypothetical protein
MTPAEIQYVHAAAQLSRVAPESFADFVRAAQVFSAQQTSHCIQSPIEHLPVAQGRAQIAAHLASLLADCRQLADKHKGTQK